MSGKTKKVIYWVILALFFFVGPALNLMIDKNVPFHYALERLITGPLPVKAYLVLLGILTFVCGELVMAGFQISNKLIPLGTSIVLAIGWYFTHYHYFLLLMIFSLAGTLLIFILEKRKEDAIHSVLETVMSDELMAEEEKEDEDIMEIIEENEEPEVSVEPEEPLNDIQQREINQFLDSLFDKPENLMMDETPLEEPFAKEILSDANEFLEAASEEEMIDEIKKEPPKEVVLEKEEIQSSEDLLENELAKKDEPLGKFDEEIPLDDLIK